LEDKSRGWLKGGKVIADIAKEVTISGKKGVSRAAREREDTNDDTET
jgi:hypothetical protein